MGGGDKTTVLKTQQEDMCKLRIKYQYRIKSRKHSHHILHPPPIKIKKIKTPKNTHARELIVISRSITVGKGFGVIKFQKLKIFRFIIEKFRDRRGNVKTTTFLR